MIDKILKVLEYFNIKRPEIIIHIGANTGQEVEKYEALNLTGYLVEAIPTVFNTLKEKCSTSSRQYAINACLSDIAGKEISFNVASNGGQSSSIFALGRHAIEYPSIKYTNTIKLTTETVDNLVDSGKIPKSINFMVIDVQGAEILVLKGADKILSSKDLIGLVVEVSVAPLYEGGANFIQVCELLAKFGFFLQNVNFNRHGWADALFLRQWWRIKS
ncbi:MAG: FkbM family methyltransferase [Rhodoferax sp.]|uniref:FkbM family methyltransferase n=1 Tax=Rhodoferax sp. TaxID=50421 RepID=UPI00273655BF|nr:FkbM family methyltransferase [Rhodoferax sp.]MDP2677321.1 FkbM family methyltransferase [Rhodoferax sp.]